jgi:hypothetical protein
MIEEGVITGIDADARPGTTGRGGQAGLAQGLRRPSSHRPAVDPGLAIRHRQDPAAGLAGTRHAVSGDGLRLAPPHRHRVHARSAAGHRYRSRRARAGPPPARRRPPCHTDSAAASRSPRSPPASQPADRTLMPDSPLTSHTAASPHGRPGRAPDLRTPGRPRPPCTPGHRTARVTTAISAPPVPGPDGMRARAQRRPSSHRRAARATRPWPSVKKPTVHTDRPGGRTPSAICPWTPRHRDLQRYKLTHHGTEKKRPG